MTDSHQISKGNLDRFKTWNNLIFNGEKSMTNLDWIGDNHDEISKFITDHYKSKASQHSHLSSLAVYFRDINKNSETRKKYGQASLVIGKEHEKIVEQNKQLENRPLITHEQIIKIRDMLKNHEFETFDDNQKYLIFSLYTMMYPLRKEWTDVEILNGYKGSNPNKNYIIVDDFKKKKTSYELHLASGVKKHGELILPLTRNLSKIIWQSVQKYPRKYILSSKIDRNQPLTKDSFGIILKNYNLGIDQIRSSRTTHEFHKPDITRERKEDMATKMRTSVDMLDKYYNKVQNIKKIKVPVEITTDTEQKNIDDRKERNRLAGIKYRAKQSKDDVARKKREQRARAKLIS